MKRYFCIKTNSIIAIIVMLVLLASCSSSEQRPGFGGEKVTDVKPLSLEEGELISSNIDFNYSEKEQAKLKFEEFAVSTNGNYAVLMRSLTSFITINVYDSSSEFLFSYKFHTGQHVLLKWKGDTLGIYLARSKRFLYYDNQGNLVECFELLDTRESRDYIFETIEAQSVEMDDGTVYFASNNGINEDNKREKKYLHKDDGTEVTILYIAEGNSVHRLVISVIIVVFVVAAVMLIRRNAQRTGSLN